jgi:hypothetical protein
VGLDLPSSPNGRPATDGGEGAPTEGRAALQQPESPASASGLPPIADKADDLEEIKKAVEDAAAVSGALWFSYLFVLFYFAVAAGAVTHADLFFENAVKLPFLNIDLPLLAFFFLAPILFVITHAYTLVHLRMLADKSKRFHQALHTQIGDEDDGGARASIRAGLQWQLPSNIFVQFLAGPPELRASLFGSLLRGIAWSTLVVAPLLLLLLMQIKFLPFHSAFITWTHRIALLADLGLVWWLWREILSGRGRRRPASWGWTGLGLALSACVVLFSWTAATFPGEWQEDHLANWDGLGGPISLHDWVFNLPFDSNTGSRASPFSSTLVLPDLDIYAGLKIDDPEKVKWRKYVFVAGRRNLRGAILVGALLPKVDLTGAELQGASLFAAQLQGASLFEAQLQGASLDLANLQGASLFAAQLQGASLLEAQLQGATLNNANLQGASLDWAQLQGAALDNAQLQGASLLRAQLQGASLRRAQLQGASLQLAQVAATDLSSALLWRTNRPAPSGFNFSKPATLRFAVALDWRPVRFVDGPPWSEKAYEELRKSLESLPLALERIKSLDCASLDTTLAPCDPDPALTPPDAAAWRTALEDARVEDSAYAKALAAALKTLVCSGDEDAAYVLGGLLREYARLSSRLEAVGPEAPRLVDEIINTAKSTDCPVSALLTDADRSKLLRIKQDATKKAGG